MYGDLEGKSKPEIAREWGAEAVQSIRIGMKGRPPPMKPDHPHWHFKERKYSDLKSWEMPLTESLEDTMKRTIPLLEKRIIPDLKAGQNVMVVAHVDSLRGIVQYLDNISNEEIADIGIPVGIPLVYKFDSSMKPIRPADAIGAVSGEYLEKESLLQNELQKLRLRAQRIPGLYNEDYNGNQVFLKTPALWNPTQNLNYSSSYFYSSVDTDSSQRDSLQDESFINDPSMYAANSVFINFNRSAAASVNSSALESEFNTAKQKKQAIVMIRHGKTVYNKLGIFTGENVIK